MLPAIRIGGQGCWGCSSSISQDRLREISEVGSPQEAGERMTCWERLKNFFCGTRQEEAQQLAYLLMHPETAGKTAEERKRQLTGWFLELQGLAHPTFRDRFVIEENERNGMLNLRVICETPYDLFKVTLHTRGAAASNTRLCCRITVGGKEVTPIKEVGAERAGERTPLLDTSPV